VVECLGGRERAGLRGDKEIVGVRKELEGLRLIETFLVICHFVVHFELFCIDLSLWIKENW
jgi:hypothetical protein